MAQSFEGVVSSEFRMENAVIKVSLKPSQKLTFGAKRASFAELHTSNSRSHKLRQSSRTKFYKQKQKTRLSTFTSDS